MLPFAAAATATDVPDMSLTDELIIRNDVISHYFGQNNAVQTTYLQSIDNLIPDGAVLLSEYVYEDNIVFIDYSFGGIRYIVEYFKDGSIRKSSRNPDNNYIQISSTFSSLVETQSIPENNSIIEPSAENSCWDQDTAYPITDISNRASIKRVDPLSYQDDPSTKPYKAKVVLEKQVSIPALADAGYSTSQLGRVYETMSYHREDKLKTKSYNTAATITSIALAFVVAPGTVSNWLSRAGVATDITGLLQEQCDIIQEHGYKYSGFKECGIYDPTRYKRIIEINNEWGEGHITLVWQYNSVSGYNTPKWGHDKRSSGLMIDNETVLETGRNAYNLNIADNGFWNWDPGEFGA